jgi:sulfite reductase subunit B
VVAAQAETGPPPAGHSVYLPEPARVLGVERLTELETLYSMALASGAPLGHAPGQFVQVSIFGMGECPISVCSSPTRREGFELCVRRVGVVTEHIHRLRPGDVIGVRGPLGHGFDVGMLRGRDLLVVAGGCGLAPTRSLIQYVLDRRDEFGRFDLLYGVREEKELLFREELERWTAGGAIDLRISVDRASETWRGRVGLVTTLFRDLRPLNAQKTSVVIVGPPAMYRFVLIEVLARGVPEQQIFCSLERRMKCGVGRCGHCQVNSLYACQDGPVFTYAQLKALREALE